MQSLEKKRIYSIVALFALLAYSYSASAAAGVSWADRIVG
jgi:hypothetical protein